jgi:hypothetical protein
MVAGNGGTMLSKEAQICIFIISNPQLTTLW